MTEASRVPPIERMVPQGKEHSLAKQGTLDEVTGELGPQRQFLPLVDFLRAKAAEGVDPFEARREVLRVDASGKEQRRNPHLEEFVIKTGSEIKVASLEELRDLLKNAGVNVEVLGLHSVGNPFQRVYGGLQDYSEKNSKSGFERPVVAEGPAMILAPYAFDNDGEMHIFRSIQLRQGEAVVDVARGFADAKTLESGAYLYDVNKLGERVKANLTRVVGEEAGKQLLKIKRIIFLGSLAGNTSSTKKGAKGAYFGVEVDYNNFIQSNKVVSEEEFERRREQLEHEGLTGTIIDMTLDEYINYKRDSSLTTRDASTDAGTDIVVIDFLGRQFAQLKFLKEGQEHNREIKRRQKAWLVSLKHRNPKAYREMMETRAVEVKKK